MCIISTTCVTANAETTVSGTAGYNTLQCVCNNGYVQSITVNTTPTPASLTSSCVCNTANGLSSQVFNSLKYCCPLNVNIPASQIICGCNSSATEANKYMKYVDMTANSTLWMCV